MNTRFFVVVGALGAVFAAGQALADPSLQIKNAAVRVIVLPENRPDIAVEINRPNPRLPLSVDRFGDQVIIDGHLPDFFTTCHGGGPDLRAFVFGHGDYPVSEFPLVIVHTPMNAEVTAGGIVQGSVGRSQDVTLQQAGCGSWTVANVADHLDARVSGVGDIRAGTSRSADLTLTGSGHISAVSVMGLLSARISGSGAITAQTAGSADLTITGSGSIKTGPLSGGLNADISGEGGLDVASVDGPLAVHVSGVGNIDVPAGHATTLIAHVSGSGNVKFGGVADSLDAEVSGVGNVDVAKVTGTVNQHVSGVGSVHVGGQ